MKNLHLSIMLAAGLAMPASAEELTYGVGAPERAVFVGEGVIPMLAAIAKESGGNVTFRGFFGTVVQGAGTTLPALKSGAVDSGFVLLGPHSAALPYASLVGEMGGIGAHPLAVMGAANEALLLHCPKCLEDMRREGQEPIWVVASSPVTMACVDDATKAADLKGRRVAVVGASERRWAERLGMAATSTKITDLATTLELGRADCAVIPTTWIRSYGLGDTVKSVIEMPQGIGSSGLPLVIRSEKWDALAEADRKAIYKAVAFDMRRYYEKSYQEPDVSVKQEMSGKIAFHPGDEALAQAWTGHQGAEMGELKAIAERRGLENGDAMIDTFVEVFERWHTVHLPKFRDNPEAFDQIVWDEVFSKL